MAAAGELTGKVALVTGGAGGVGSAVVGLLAQRGATVYLNCFHSFAAGRKQAEELTAAGHDVRVLRGSVGKPDHVERMIAEIAATSGRLEPDTHGEPVVGAPGDRFQGLEQAVPQPDRVEIAVGVGFGGATAPPCSARPPPTAGKPPPSLPAAAMSPTRAISR
ncbi:SDR family NAD(P)-dependent oxidoreductase [Nocardia tengchongensis]